MMARNCLRINALPTDVGGRFGAEPGALWGRVKKSISPAIKKCAYGVTIFGFYYGDAVRL